MFITPRRLLLIIGLALLTASPSRGEVGLLVLEPVDAATRENTAARIADYLR